MPTLTYAHNIHFMVYSNNHKYRCIYTFSYICYIEYLIYNTILLNSYETIYSFQNYIDYPIYIAINGLHLKLLIDCILCFTLLTYIFFL